MIAKQQYSPDDMIIVGEITGAHGIKGQVKAECLTDFPEVRFAPGAELYVEKLRQNRKVLAASVHKGLYLLTLDGIEDRDAAQALLHTYLRVPMDSLPPLPEGEYYHFQLIGLQVFEGERYLGQLTEIMETGANDVYIIKNAEPAPGLPAEILLPALQSCIKQVDLAAGRMQVQIPAGLLD